MFEAACRIGTDSALRGPCNGGAGSNASTISLQRLKVWALRCCVSLLVLTCPPVTVAAAVATFQANLVRESSLGSRPERISGRIFFDAASEKLLIEVQAPVHQWVIVQGSEMLLYYPEAKQAFRVVSKSDAFMPFFRVIWNCFKEDFDLPRQGYTMVRHQKKGNALLSTWSPPSQLSRVVGEATLEYSDSKLTRVEHKTARGNLLSRAVFGQHVPVSGYSFPLEVTISYGSKQGVTEERVIYSEPRFDLPLPADIVNFKIPDGISVKDVVW